MDISKICSYIKVYYELPSIVNNDEKVMWDSYTGITLFDASKKSILLVKNASIHSIMALISAFLSINISFISFLQIHNKIKEFVFRNLLLSIVLIIVLIIMLLVYISLLVIVIYNYIKAYEQVKLTFVKEELNKQLDFAIKNNFITKEMKERYERIMKINN